MMINELVTHLSLKMICSIVDEFIKQDWHIALNEVSKNCSFVCYTNICEIVTIHFKYDIVLMNTSTGIGVSHLTKLVKIVNLFLAPLSMKLPPLIKVLKNLYMVGCLYA